MKIEPIIILICIFSSITGISQNEESPRGSLVDSKYKIEKKITFQYVLTLELGTRGLMEDSINTQKTNLLYNAMTDDESLVLYVTLHDDFKSMEYKVSGVDFLYMGAKKVLNKLLRRGINHERIKSITYAQLTENEIITEEMRSKNRRIECVLYKEE